MPVKLQFSPGLFASIQASAFADASPLCQIGPTQNSMRSCCAIVDVGSKAGWLMHADGHRRGCRAGASRSKDLKSKVQPACKEGTGLLAQVPSLA
eukprot:COSAG06_NODE_1637_length_8848_cov_481.713224_8_plen_95_part_00